MGLTMVQGRTVLMQRSRSPPRQQWLAACPQLGDPALLVVLIDNAGGGIFGHVD